MKKATVAATMLAMLTIFAAPAPAQEEGITDALSATAPAGGSGQSGGQPGGSGIPAYEFDAGWVYIDGDIRTDCTSFAEGIEYERTPGGGDLPAGALKALDGCEEAGLLSPSLVAEVDEAVGPSSDDPRGAQDSELPDTGGPALPNLLCATVTLLAACVLITREVAA